MSVNTPSTGFQISAVRIASRGRPATGVAKPPATSTRPSASSVAVCHIRGVPIDPVGVNLPLTGS